MRMLFNIIFGTILVLGLVVFWALFLNLLKPKKKWPAWVGYIIIIGAWFGAIRYYLLHQVDLYGTLYYPLMNMFRTESYSKRTAQGITYRTALLDSYRAAFEAEKHSIIRWQQADFQQFPYTAFLKSFTQSVYQNDRNAILSLLPVFAWCKAHSKENFTDMELVSELISEYTSP